MSNKILLSIIGIMLCNTVNAATNVSLADMFKDCKENEYAFNQKYKNKELTFNAIVDSIDPDCYVKFSGTDSDSNIPCIKLSDPNTKVEIFGLETSMTKAVMKNKDDLLKLRRGQKISLTCILKDKAVFDFDSFSFGNCTLN